MSMQIPELGSLQLNRTHPAHAGNAPLSPVGGAPRNAVSAAGTDGTARPESTRTSFEALVVGAVDKVNQQQIDVTHLEQQLITDPDSVDIHDVTTAMAKAQMSLSLAQTVIDRIITGWNELSTTR